VELAVVRQAARGLRKDLSLRQVQTVILDYWLEHFHQMDLVIEMLASLIDLD